MFRPNDPYKYEDFPLPTYKGDCPCDGCIHADKCYANHLSCMDYAAHLDETLKTGRRPCRAIYEVLFDGAPRFPEMGIRPEQQRRQHQKQARMGLVA